MLKKFKTWLLAAIQRNTLLMFALFPFVIVYIYLWQKPKIKRMQQAQSAELAIWDSDDHAIGHDHPVRPSDTEDVCRLYNAKALPDLAPVYGKRLRRVIALRNTTKTYAHSNDADTFWLVFEGKTTQDEYWVTTDYRFSKFEEYFYGGLIAFESEDGKTIKPRVPVGVTLLERPAWQALMGLPLKSFSCKSRYDPPRPDITLEFGAGDESQRGVENQNAWQLCFDWRDEERKKPFVTSEWEEWMTIDVRGNGTHFALRSDVQEALERPSSLDSDRLRTFWHEPAQMQALAALHSQLQRFTLWFETKAVWHSTPVSVGKSAHPDDWLAHRRALWQALDALAAWRVLLLHGVQINVSFGAWQDADGMDYGEAWMTCVAHADEWEQLQAILKKCSLPILLTEAWWDREESLQAALDPDHPNPMHRPAWINGEALSHPAAQGTWAQRVWTRYGVVLEAYSAWYALSTQSVVNVAAAVQEDESAFAAYLATLLGHEIVQGDGYPTKDERQVQINWPPYPDTLTAALPPYSADDLAQLEAQWSRADQLGIVPHLQTCPRWVIGKDDGSGKWLLGVGFDVRKGLDGTITCIPRLRFPSSWPATHNGRGKVSCMNGSVDWREYNRIGEAARPTNWHLRVVGYDLHTQELGLWGMVDLEGRFVLPCQFTEMSAAHGLLGVREHDHIPPLPAGRKQDWCWSAVRKPSDPSVDALGRKVVDVIEVWSGRRVNPDGIKALADSLNWGYFVACSDTAVAQLAPAPHVGLMRATQAAPGEMRWLQIYNHYTPSPAVAACCAVTGLWGYIGALGQVVVEPQFLKASSFNSRLAYVRTTHGLMGAIAFDLTRKELEHLPLEATNLPLRWVLAPKWPHVVDEFDGHFTVQDERGNWGMVNPKGEAVTPFDVMTEFLNKLYKWDEPNSWSSSRDDHIRYNDAHSYCREQFKELQQARVLSCLVEIANSSERSMGAMAGLLYSSYGAYDYGSLAHSNCVLRLEREVMSRKMEYGGTQGDREVELLLPVGTQLAWDGAQRIYAGFADLSTHAVLTELGKQDHTLQVPWNALSLVVPQPTRDLGKDASPEHKERQLAELAEGQNLLIRWQTASRDMNATALSLEKTLNELTKELRQHVYVQAESPVESDWSMSKAYFETGRMVHELARLRLAVALQDAQGMVWHSTAFRYDVQEAKASSTTLQEDALQTTSDLFELWQLVLAACADFLTLLGDGAIKDRMDRAFVW